ncbi:ABC transporter substrate-binding protein [Enterococcus sp. AZ192]|uniref:ABC transporter substrate-binding protein n=1 Tax=unclassified Enterococcus TaxID=2608891 RepID=UPI003D28D4A0
MDMSLEEKELDELYTLAVEELADTGESLIVWAGGDAVNQQDTLAKLFTARFPKIPIDIKVELSKIHDLKIYEELLNGDLTPDVTMLQTSNDFEDWKKLGVLESFKPLGFSQIRDEFKDPEGDFSVFRMFAFLPQYAKEGISTVPSTLMDMLTPDYQNKLVLTYPHDDDAVLYVYDQMIKKHGEQFLADLAKLNPLFIRGTAGPPLLVGKNQLLGSLTGYETIPTQPSQSFIPEKDFFISWGQRIAMFKLTKHKAAARLFLAFVQSYGFQESLGHYSVRKDISFDDQPWIGSHPTTNPLGFYEFMRDRKTIGSLRKMMEQYFGPVQGESPVVDHKMIKLTYGG